MPKLGYSTTRHHQHVLTDVKRVFRIVEVAQLAQHVPHWPELSVQRIWPLAIQFPLFFQYMPDEYDGGRRVDRGFFWGVLGTLEPEFVRHLVDEARRQRQVHRAARAVPPTLINVAPGWLGELLGGHYDPPGKYPSSSFSSIFSLSSRTTSRTSHLPGQATATSPSATKATGPSRGPLRHEHGPVPQASGRTAAIATRPDERQPHQSQRGKRDGAPADPTATASHPPADGRQLP